MTTRLFMLALASLLATGGTAHAGGRFTPPLPASELAKGSITVKVVGKGMSDIKVGKPVKLLRGSAEVQTVSTGKDGRALFSGLESGVTYALASADGARSQPFQAPADGGLRFLLFLEAQVSAMTGGSSGPSPSPSKKKMPRGHPPVSGTAPRAPEGDGAATVEEAKDLAPGQVQVRVVKGRKKAPVAGVKVVVVGRAQVQVVKGHPVVSPTQGQRLITDRDGKANITLAVPKEKENPDPQVFMVTHAKLTYRSRGLTPSASHGHRVTFQVYDRTSSTAALVVKPGVQLLSRVTEGAVSFMQVLSLENTGDAIIHPGTTGLRLPLPEGARSVEVHRVYKDLVHVDSEREQLQLLIPIPPGSQEVRYFYELPFKSPELDLRMTMPMATAAGSASMLGLSSVSMLGPAITGSKVHAVPGEAAKQQKVYTLGPVAAGGVLEVTFTGLPHDSKGRTVAMVIALASLLVLWAMFAAIGGARRTRDREARKTRLLDELAALERDGGDKKKKARLMGQLKEVWEPEP